MGGKWKGGERKTVQDKVERSKVVMTIREVTMSRCHGSGQKEE